MISASPSRISFDPGLKTLYIQALFHGEEYLTQSKEPDDSHDKIETAHEVDEPKGHAELSAYNIHSHSRKNETEQDGRHGLERGCAAQPDKGAKGEHHDREDLRRAELQGELRYDGREKGEHDDANNSSDTMGQESEHEGLTGLSALCHGVAVEGGRH